MEVDGLRWFLELRSPGAVRLSISLDLLGPNSERKRTYLSSLPPAADPLSPPSALRPPVAAASTPASSSATASSAATPTSSTPTSSSTRAVVLRRLARVGLRVAACTAGAELGVPSSSGDLEMQKDQPQLK